MVLPFLGVALLGAAAGASGMYLATHRPSPPPPSPTPVIVYPVATRSGRGTGRCGIMRRGSREEEKEEKEEEVKGAEAPVCDTCELRRLLLSHTCNIRELMLLERLKASADAKKAGLERLRGSSAELSFWLTAKVSVSAGSSSGSDSSVSGLLETQGLVLGEMVKTGESHRGGSSRAPHRVEARYKKTLSRLEESLCSSSGPLPAVQTWGLSLSLQATLLVEGDYSGASLEMEKTKKHTLSLADSILFSSPFSPHEEKKLRFADE